MDAIATDEPDGSVGTKENITDRLGLLRGLADRLDDVSERHAARAKTAGRYELEMSLLDRAAVYQECAGLIREALK